MGYYKKLAIAMLDESDAEARRVCRNLSKEVTAPIAMTLENDSIQDKLLEERYSTAITVHTETLFEQINGHPRRP